MSDFWFRPKTHGYGAYPTGWQGWALILGVFLGNIALMAVLFGPPLLAGEVPGLARFGLFALADTALVIGFLILVRNKTDGAWRWRWGKG